MWNLILTWIATAVIAYALTPKPRMPKDAAPATIDDFDFPTAEDGREIPVLFGTREMSGPNVVWYGDLVTENITEKVDRGPFRSSKRVTVGYKYFLGAHMGLVHGPVDSLNRIRVADKVAWVGALTESGSIVIEQEELFGGDDGEGGIDGTFTFANGDPLQIQSVYLQGNLGTPLPAFRGVTCGIVEQMYVSSNNPYLKPWAFFMTRTDITTRGETQWYVAKARIPTSCGLAEPSYEVFIGDLLAEGAYWEPPEGVTEVDVFLVGDGGRGTSGAGTSCRAGGGGGGGGQVRLVKNYPVSGSIYYRRFQHGFRRGWDVEFGDLVALGGSDSLREDMEDDTFGGWNGGGGHGYADWSTDPHSLKIFGSSPYTGGFPGGTGAGNVTFEDGYGSGGGGGGSGGPGESAAAKVPGNGGIGVYVPEFAEYGDEGWFGGGGGGYAAAWNNAACSSAVGSGGKGGGGDALQNGAPGTGGGGGGQELGSTSSAGGSGLLAVRYISPEQPIASWDMNPAHIIRECLTDKEWGMGYTDADIDDVSFTAAADTLYDEQMGISILWQRENTIEAFVQDIVRHIDAALYVDRRTGKFVLKLIRSEATPTLTLGPNNIERVENYKRPAFGDLVNSVTVIYDDCDDGKQLGSGGSGVSSGPQCIRWKMCQVVTGDDGGDLFLECVERLSNKKGTCFTDIKDAATKIHHKDVTVEEIRTDMVSRLQSFIGCEQTDYNDNGDLITYQISSISAGTATFGEETYGLRFPIDVVAIATGEPNKEVRYFVTDGVHNSGSVGPTQIDRVECDE